MVFIVIDGLDASGKSTQARRLMRQLRRRGHSVYVRFHPSNDSWAGIRARRYLLAEGRNAHFASAMFFIVDVIRSVIRCPWWLHDYVLFVRYLMGTAYLPSPLDRIAYVFFAVLLPKPTYKLYLDVAPERAYLRILENREQREMFESLEQLRKIGSKARRLALLHGWSVVDGNLKEEEVQSRILLEVTGSVHR
jgi:dTMP kinase